MPNQIGLNELFKAQEILSFTTQLKKDISEIAASLDKIPAKKPFKTTGQGIEKANKEMNELNQLTKDQIRINKQAEQRILRVSKIRANNTEKQRRNEERLNKQRERDLKKIQAQRERVNKQAEQRLLRINRIQEKRIENEKKLQAAVNKSSSITGKVIGKLKQLLGVLGLIGGVTILANVVKDSIKLAGIAEGVRSAFNKLNDPNLLGDLRKATKGTVTDLQLMQSAVKAKNFKIPLDQLATFFEFATKRASETGESVDFLVESIINGIGRKSPLILDNLGISAAQLSAEFKKTGDFGAAAGKIINEELGKMGDVVETGAQKTARMAVTFKNIQTQIGERLLPVINRLLDIIQEVIAVLSGPNSLSDAISSVRDLFREQFQAVKELIAAFRGANAEAITIRDVINSLGSAINFTLKPIKALIKFNTKLIEAWTFLISKGRDLLEFLGILDKEERLRQEEIERLQKAEAERLAQIDAYTQRLKEHNKEIDNNTESTDKNTKSKDKNSKATKKQITATQKLNKSILEGALAIVTVTEARRKKDIKAAEDDFKLSIANFEKQQAIEKQAFSEFTATEKLRVQFGKEQQEELTRFKAAEEIKFLEIKRGLLNVENELGIAQIDTQVEQLKAKLAELNQTIQPEDKDKPGKFSIWRALGLTEDQAKIADEVVITARNTLDEIFTKQIDNYNVLLQKSEERISKLESELDAEIKRDKDGDASRKDSLKRRLEAERENERKILQAKEKAARRKKQIAITEAVINTALSVTNALKTDPFILGLILAIAAAAKGVTEINKIRNAQFAEGTESVPLGGNKPGRDTVPAMLTAKERVVPVSINEELNGFPNKLLPAAVNHFISAKGLQKREQIYNFANMGGVEARQDETNSILKELNGKESIIYHEGKVKEIIRANIKTIYI